MVDRYTKGVLTLIALLLAALVAQNGTQMARAAMDYNDVCGTPTHPPCHVFWTTAMPVRQ